LLRKAHEPVKIDSNLDVNPLEFDFNLLLALPVPCYGTWEGSCNAN
jgi:hypothetical protein